MFHRRSSTPPKERKLAVYDALCLKKSPYGQHPSTWFADRFEQWHKLGIAIVSGSTFAHGIEEYDEKVLDAAAGRKYYDENGVLKRTALMTLDGLGHDPRTLGDNEAMVGAFDAALSSADTIDLPKTLTTAGKTVREQREKEARSNNRRKRQVIENGSAIAVAVVEHDAKKDQMQCHLGNIGDTIAIVLDKKTLTIKSKLAARQYLQGNYSGEIKFCPTPAHLIGDKPEALLSQTIDVSPDDVVILMTDGISDELPCETTEQELKHQGVKATSPKSKDAKTTPALRYREVQLKKDALEKALAPLKSKEQASEYEIATAIVEHIEGQIITKRAKDIELQEAFNQWIRENKSFIEAHINEVSADSADEGGMVLKNKDKYTMQQWFAWKEKHPKTAADEKYPKYPFSQFKEDLTRFLPFVQVCFPQTKDTKLEDRTVIGFVYYNLFKCQPRSGDCATLSVMRIPDPDVELVRAWIDFPENREQLLPRLVNRITKKHKEDKSFDILAWKKNVVAKLAAETYIRPGSRGKADTVVKKPVYQEKQLMMEIRYPCYAIQQAIHAEDSIEERYAIQKAIHVEFTQSLENKDTSMSVEERNKAFEAFKKTSHLHLIHRHNWIDWIFGIKNTASWKTTVGQVRSDALDRLKEEVKAKKDNKEKIALLKSAREMAIFKDHRNNSVFFGAFGRTHTVQLIDEEIETIENLEKKLNNKR